MQVSPYGRDGRDVLRNALLDLETAPAARGNLFRTLRDIALIALAWMIFVGAVMYPAVQIVGIVACAVVLLAGRRRDAAKASVEI